MLKFFVEKVLPSFIFWACTYLILGKVLMPMVLKGESIDWTFLLDFRALAIVLLGVSVTIGVGWIFGKSSNKLSWFYKKMREEATSAVLTTTSLFAVILIASGSLLPVPLVLVAGYLIAYKVA